MLRTKQTLLPSDVSEKNIQPTGFMSLWPATGVKIFVIIYTGLDYV